MNFEGVIQNGDVIGVREPIGLSIKGVFRLLIRVLQRVAGLGKYSMNSHVSIAWWFDDVLYSIEMDGVCNVCRPLSQLIDLGCKIQVYKNPVGSNMKSYKVQMIEYPITYSFLDLLVIGLRLIFRFNTAKDKNTDMVCSTFVSQWLQLAGWFPPTGFPNKPAPAEICKALGEPIALF